jgi:hypothetical protein
VLLHVLFLYLAPARELLRGIWVLDESEAAGLFMVVATGFVNTRAEIGVDSNAVV